MSRRSKWENMRLEARNRVDAMDAKSSLDAASKSESAGHRSGPAKETDTTTGQLAERSGRRSPEREGEQLKNDNGRNKNSDGSPRGAVGVEGNAGPQDATTTGSLFSVVPGDGSPLLTTLSSPICAGVLDGNCVSAGSTLVFCEGMASTLSTAEKGDPFASLQLELAQEKKKNIAAEQRLLALDKEVKVLRTENMQLASAGAEKANVSASAALRAPSTGRSNAAKIEGQTHLGQMAEELQEELRLLKEYTRELESRLAEKTKALESCKCELEQKEQRIRQLERTIADELIRRSKAEADGQSGSPGKNKLNTSGVEARTDKGMRDDVISRAVVPSVIHRSAVFPRSQSERERNDGHNTSSSVAAETHDTSFAQLPAFPSSARRTPQRGLASPPRCNSRGGEHRTARGSRHSDPNMRGDGQKSSLNSSVTSSLMPTTRRSVVHGNQKTTPSATFSVLRTRYMDASSASVARSSRPSSVTRKKVPCKATPHRPRSRRKNASPSPPPTPSFMKDSLRDDVSPTRSMSSRRGVNRPPPLEPSMASVASATTGAGMLHRRESRFASSVAAASVRSRPLIHHDGNGITTLQTLSTTVITRSSRRRESPICESLPRPDSVESVPSDRPFVSGKFAETTYHPNRLVRCWRGDSHSPARSVTPTREETTETR